jgi:hypothetical protein
MVANWTNSGMLSAAMGNVASGVLEHFKLALQLGYAASGVRHCFFGKRDPLVCLLKLCRQTARVGLCCASLKAERGDCRCVCCAGA